MRNCRSTILRASLIAISLVAMRYPLFADDSSTSVSASAADKDPSEKTVNVNIGGKTMPVRVKQQANPLDHAAFPDDLDPRRVFSATNPMANKSFSLPSSSFSHGNTEFTDPTRNAFPTKAYTDAAASSLSAPDTTSKSPFPTFASYSRQASDFDKSFPIPHDGITADRAEAFSSSSDEQNRTASLGKPAEPAILSSDPFANKTYLGPGAQNIPDNIAIKDDVVISRMSGMPSRPLTIDEVRDLINHETKPNTDAKPPEPSKPLNDPGYVPEPLRDNPSPDSAPPGNEAIVPSLTKSTEVPTSTTPSDDDKTDAVPSPGTIATPPENSEPLPQP